MTVEFHQENLIEAVGWGLGNYPGANTDPTAYYKGTADRQDLIFEGSPAQIWQLSASPWQEELKLIVFCKLNPAPKWTVFVEDEDGDASLLLTFHGPAELFGPVIAALIHESEI